MYSPIGRNGSTKAKERDSEQRQETTPKDYIGRGADQPRENPANESVNHSVYSSKYEQIYEKQVASLQKQKQSLYEEWGRDKQQFREMQRILQAENEALRA